MTARGPHAMLGSAFTARLVHIARWPRSTSSGHQAGQANGRTSSRSPCIDPRTSGVITTSESRSDTIGSDSPNMHSDHASPDDVRSNVAAGTDDPTRSSHSRSPATLAVTDADMPFWRVPGRHRVVVRGAAPAYYYELAITACTNADDVVVVAVVVPAVLGLPRATAPLRVTRW